MPRKNTGLVFLNKSFLDLPHFSLILGPLDKESPSMAQLCQSKTRKDKPPPSSFAPIYRNRSFKPKRLPRFAQSEEPQVLPIAARIIVTKKQGNAVLRAKIRRRIKEALRIIFAKPEQELKNLIDQRARSSLSHIGLVVLTKNLVLEEKFSSLKSSFLRGLKSVAKKDFSNTRVRQRASLRIDKPCPADESRTRTQS